MDKENKFTTEETENSPAAKQKKDPDERVAHMNAIFDKYVVPILIFTLAVFLCFGLAPKLFACGKSDSKPVSDYAEISDFYIRRSALLSDMGKASECFEQCGYTLVPEDGMVVAYKQLDSGVEIMENLTDSNGHVFSAVSVTDKISDGREADITIMVYSRSVMLVSVTCGEEVTSAIFSDDAFSPASDGDTSAVLSLVSSERLCDMLEQYKSETVKVYEVFSGSKDK